MTMTVRVAKTEMVQHGQTTFFVATALPENLKRRTTKSVCKIAHLVATIAAAGGGAGEVSLKKSNQTFPFRGRGSRGCVGFG